MAGSLDVVVKFIGDASSIQSEVSKVEGTGSKLKSWAKGVGVAIGGAFAVNAVKDWIGAAEEANAASARLAQTLANAGDTTGKFTKYAEMNANSLMKLTGIDDEVIKGGQAILATFHSVGGELGQTSGVFARATQASLDLSKTGFGDVDSAAKALGKALEDPEQGLTALKKSGVNFTDAQKEQIKALVETGNKAEAMKTILREVEGQVGGVAEKTATGGAKMKVAFGEMQESLGRALLPALEKLAPILEKIAGFIEKNAGVLIPLAAAIGAVVIATWAWNVAMAANPITLIAIGIAALIAGIVLLINHWDDVKKAAEAALDFILEAVQTVWEWIKDNWPTLLAILAGPFGIAVLLIVKNWDTVKDIISGAVDFIVGIMAGVGQAIAAPFQWAWEQIQSIAGSIKDAIGGAIGFVKDIWNGFARGWNGIKIHIPSVDLPVIGEVGGGTVSLPNLPILDQGGIVSRPTLALLAANSRPEAVVPLDRMGSTYNITVNAGGLGADAPEIQRAVVEAIRGYVDRNGRLYGITN